MKIFLLVFMLMAHLVDDYYLQGWLASAKSKKYWEKNSPDKLYKFDYIMALFCHALSWSIMTFLPILIYSLITHIDLQWFYLAIPINLCIHAVIDDLKANKGKLNLVIDQCLHFVQIVVTWLIFTLVF